MREGNTVLVLSWSLSEADLLPTCYAVLLHFLSQSSFPLPHVPVLVSLFGLGFFFFGGGGGGGGGAI